MGIKPYFEFCLGGIASFFDETRVAFELFHGSGIAYEHSFGGLMVLDGCTAIGAFDVDFGDVQVRDGHFEGIRFICDDLQIQSDAHF
jgi:hypothetical protein